MSNATDRLIECFEQALPNLSREEIETADMETVADWDSVAHVTLLSLIQEEFSVEADFEEFEDATSFDAVLDWVEERAEDD